MWLAPWRNGSENILAPLLSLAGHRHKAHRKHRAFGQLVFLLLQNHQFLISQRADGNDQPSVFLELPGQWWRHMLRRAGHDDPIKRRGFTPPGAALADAQM